MACVQGRRRNAKVCVRKRVAIRINCSAVNDPLLRCANTGSEFANRVYGVAFRLCLVHLLNGYDLVLSLV